MAVPGFCSCAIRTCSRRLYLFLNFFWQCSHWRGDCSVCWVRICLHKLTVVITSLQNWHWDHLLAWPSKLSMQQFWGAGGLNQHFRYRRCDVWCQRRHSKTKTGNETKHKHKLNYKLKYEIKIVWKWFNIKTELRTKQTENDINFSYELNKF